jgi:hypothetical protein
VVFSGLKKDIMKYIYYFSIASLLMLFIGCSTSNIGSKYEFKEPDSSINSDIGYLKIYTSHYEETGYFSEDPPYKLFKGYSVYIKDGDLVKNIDKSINQPNVVKLPKSEYVLVAELEKNIVNSFTVKIEKGKLLEINSGNLENSSGDLSSN